MLKFAAIAVISLAVAGAGAAHAQSVDRRHAYQQERINRGVVTGRLTPVEAARVERQQARINRAESRARARNGGYLTRANRARLQARENRASRHIYRAKHNARSY